jgi:hypothetical protein
MTPCRSGFYNLGIGRLKDGRLSMITARQGQADNFISQLVGDQRRWLWIGSDGGISRVALNELNAVAGGTLARDQAIHYGSDEGLPPLQAKYGFGPAAMRSDDGRIWMTMATALTVIHPERVAEPAAPPPVCLQ